MARLTPEQRTQLAGLKEDNTAEGMRAALWWLNGQRHIGLTKVDFTKAPNSGVGNALRIMLEDETKFASLIEARLKENRPEKKPEGAEDPNRVEFENDDRDRELARRLRTLLAKARG